MNQLEQRDSPSRYKSVQRLYVGVILTGATVFLVYLLATEAFQRNNAARYVASFITGLFGYTAIETLRRGLD